MEQENKVCEITEMENRFNEILEDYRSIKISLETMSEDADKRFFKQTYCTPFEALLIINNKIEELHRYINKFGKAVSDATA